MAKNPHAVALGSKGGKASRRLAKLSPEERRKIAMLGVEARKAKRAKSLPADGSESVSQ